MHEQPYGFLSPYNLGLWTDKSDGDLIVTSGTYTLTSGQIYNFNQVIVHPGATLRLSAGANITLIGANYIEINGTIDGRYGEHYGATYTNTNPDDGRVYSHSSPQNRGGRVRAVANGTDQFSPAWAGNGAYGNGSANRYAGGLGTHQLLNPGTTRGAGDGGYIYSGSGTAVNRTATSNSEAEVIQGGGGARGRHGQGLVLNARNILGTGSILLNGSNGGSGTSGSISSASYSSDYGFLNSITGHLSGGGGAGGNGGRLWMEYANTYSTTLYNNTNVNAGSGGGAGSVGWSNNGYSHATYGEGGLNGNGGSKSVLDLRTL